MTGLTCPNCASVDIETLSKSQMHLCEDCKHRWPLAAEPDHTASTAEVLPGISTGEAEHPPVATTSSEVLTEVLEQYPFPIAWGYHNLLAAKNAS